RKAENAANRRNPICAAITANGVTANHVRITLRENVSVTLNANARNRSTADTMSHSAKMRWRMIQLTSRVEEISRIGSLTICAETMNVSAASAQYGSSIGWP